MFIIKFYFSFILWLGAEWTPDPDTPGNRCAKPNRRYLTQLSAKVLESRITVYSISTVPFSLWAHSSWCQSSGWSIDWLQPIIFPKAENIHEFIQPAVPNPDPVLISVYVPDTQTDTDLLCSFHPYQWFMLHRVNGTWRLITAVYSLAESFFFSIYWKCCI